MREGSHRHCDPCAGCTAGAGSHADRTPCDVDVDVGVVWCVGRLISGVQKRLSVIQAGSGSKVVMCVRRQGLVAGSQPHSPFAKLHQASFLTGVRLG